MSDWYARKLSGQKPTSRPVAAPQYPPQPPPPSTTSSYPPVPGAGQQQSEYRPQGATHLNKDDGNCPECGSGDYQEVRSMGSTIGRCFSCGYPISQTGSGPAAAASGPVIAATQIHGTHNYNPSNIVGHL